VSFDDIFNLDIEIEEHVRAFNTLCDNIVALEEPSTQEALHEHFLYFAGKQAQVFNFATSTKIAARTWECILESLAVVLLRLHQVKYGQRRGEDAIVGGTLTKILIVFFSSNNPLDTEFLSELNKFDPTTLLMSFIPVILHDHGKLSIKWSDNLLKLLRLALVSAWTRGVEGLTFHHQSLVDGLPRNLTTAQKVFFGTGAVTHTRAICPKCETLFDGPEFPARCNSKRFPSSSVCDEPLTETRTYQHKGESLSRSYPILPLEEQDWPSWKARWLQQDGIEEMLEASQKYMAKQHHEDILRDFRDGDAVRNLCGPDGKPFFVSSALRTAWTISGDHFNPYFNKLAGKKASTGCYAMLCISLPPSVRYRPENVFLITALPCDPSVDNIPFTLGPIMRRINDQWKSGVWIKSTPCYPSGRREQSIVANLVTDMPGGSKLCGRAQHNHGKHFCAMCLLLKSNINTIDPSCFPMRSCLQERDAAMRWLQADSQKARDAVFQETGIRWSAFWELEYWDPTSMVVVDTMHNLWLGLAQHHCRLMLGIDWKRHNKFKATVDSEHPTYTGFVNPTTTELDKGRAKLQKAQSETQLHGVKKNVLWVLSYEAGIELTPVKEMTVPTLTRRLWVSTGSL